MLSSAAHSQSRGTGQGSASAEYFARAGEAALQIEKAVDSAAVVEVLEEASQRLGADVAIFLSFIQDDRFCPSFRYLLACDPR